MTVFRTGVRAGYEFRHQINRSGATERQNPEAGSRPLPRFGLIWAFFEVPIWDDMREKFFANIVFESMDAVENKISEACLHYEETRKLSDPSPLSHGLLIIYRWRIGMRYCYSHLYGIPQTGLRFFTVYGPWGRPDMALYLFTEAILEGRPIDVFNDGDMKRDFTYIDDIVPGVIAALDSPPDAAGGVPHRLDNIGNQRPEPLMRLIAVLEDSLGLKAEINFRPLQR